MLDRARFAIDYVLTAPSDSSTRSDTSIDGVLAEHYR